LSIMVPSNSATLSIVAIAYANVSGSFLLNASAQAGCASIADVSPLYGSTSLSVAIHVVASCGELSSGAIAGIAIGCVIAGSIVAIVIVLFLRLGWKKMEMEFRAKDLENVASLQRTAIHL
jgi:hypothetical protein